MARSLGMLRVGWRLRRRAKVFAPWKIAAHHPWSFVMRAVMENGIVWSRSVDLRLKELVSLRSASLIGCEW